MRKCKQSRQTLSKKQNAKILQNSKRAAAKQKHSAAAQQSNIRRNRTKLQREATYYAEQLRLMQELNKKSREQNEVHISVAAGVLNPLELVKMILAVFARRG